jgi:hypothetical protein
VLLHRNDRRAPGPGVATEGHDGHAGVETRRDHHRLVGVHDKGASADRAPPGPRHAAAATLQWEDEVEQHAWIVVMGSDKIEREGWAQRTLVAQTISSARRF